MKRFSLAILSIRQRLTLLICLLLISVILIFGLISYLGVKKADLKVGQDRLQTLTEQLASMLTGNTHSFISSAYAAANKTAIKKYLLSDGKDSTREALNILQEIRKDTSYVQVELRDANRTSILSSVKEGTRININIDSMLLLTSIKPDSGRVGKLYRVDDTVYYPIVATVADNKRIIGYLVRWRVMIATPKALEQLSKLLGTDARLYIGNADESLWTDMRKPVSMPLLNQKSRNQVIEYSRSKNNPVIASVRPITNSNWLVAVELSKKKILEAANHFLYWLVIAGSVILFLGIFAAWLMSLNISRPIKKLTGATSAIAAGDYSSSLVHIVRRDELGKLARSFNAMSTQVQNSQQRLEKKARYYKLLFENNPMPMWIMSRGTLNIIDVNEAAIHHYGYSREEFLKLQSTDLRPAEDVGKYLAHLNKKAQQANKSGTWRHRKKDGTIIMVDIIADDIMYKDQEARIILAHDVTEKLKIEAELVSYRIQQQKLITETTIQAQEKEREEIGKELHDNINQILASAKLYLELGMKRKEDMEPFRKTSESINLAIQEIRQLSQTLVTPSLGNSSLVETLKEMIGNFSSASSLKVELNAKDFNEELIDDDIKLMFYRVVQEQLNNILKHARAGNATVDLVVTAEKVILFVQDDGVGFDTDKARGGIGLRNITNRAKFYNGLTEIISSPGKGCTLKITVPLQQEEEI